MSKIIVANWKMYLNLKNSKDFFEQFSISDFQFSKKLKLIICPSFVALTAVNSLIHNSIRSPADKIHLGAQNCSWEESGAYTGEISPQDLKDLGCEYVILGHSERRRYFQETDEMINKKIKAVLAAGLVPIFCVGETKEQRQKGETEKVIKDQLKNGLAGVEIKAKQLFLIAYEPVWAIGTGEACNPTEAIKVHRLIKREVQKVYLSKKVPILYGGSVDDKNVASYIINEDVSGVLVGGASTKEKIFINLIKNVTKI